MKKFITSILLVSCLLVGPVMFTGCGSPIKTAYVTAGVTENTVNTALTVWAEYAVEREQTLKALPPAAATNLIAKLTQEKAQVDSLYADHEAAKALYKAAVVGYYSAQTPDASSLDIALDVLNASSKTLVDFIVTLIPEQKAKTAKLK